MTGIEQTVDVVVIGLGPAGAHRQRASAVVNPGFLHGPGNEGLIKLVLDADRGVLVGATSVGPRGGEVLTLAVHARLPVTTLRQMIYAFPTFHRGVPDALADLPD